MNERSNVQQLEMAGSSEDWKIAELEFNESDNLHHETVFSLGNGYLGMRGNFEEGFHGPKDLSISGTYINGFYTSEQIQYPEGAYGFARNTQTMLNVADAKGVAVLVNGERFSMHAGKVHKYHRELDMRAGTLVRTVEWESPGGKRVQIVFRRLVSLTRKHLAAFEVEVAGLGGGDLDIVFESWIDGAVKNGSAKDDPRVGAPMREPALDTVKTGVGESGGWLRQKVRSTGFGLHVGVEHAVTASRACRTEADVHAQRVLLRFCVNIKGNEKVTLHKFAAYMTTFDFPETELAASAEKWLQEAKTIGFAGLCLEQRSYLDRFWQRADVQIEGDLRVQQGMRYSAFQLLQAACRDGRISVGAKGLTGEGYEGHYFWDTETYVLPFFLYTMPEISRSLLEYRYRTLEQARQRAQEMAQRGALYPWRTINGEEASAYYPAGTAQVHINADIMHALRKYVEATGDREFLLKFGAEMLLETARFWADLGWFNPRRGGRFCIDGVTGPDEYTTVVNNNAYTNLMAQEHLAFAVQTARWMQENYPEEYRQLADRIGLSEEEVSLWQRASDWMFVPYDEELGITPQDDTFLLKKRWDFENTPRDKYPLLLHFHPLVIYRHQVLKQADIVLALFLLGSKFSLAEKIRNFDYYEPLTTHDSSLSSCVHGIVAAEIGRTEQAYEYLLRTVRMDLDDVNGNTADGLHIAAMAGAWLSLVNGFAGMRDDGGELKFQPVIPKAWRSYSFNMWYQNRLLHVRVTPEQAVYRLEEGAPLVIRHRGAAVELTAGREVSVDMRPKLEAVIFDLDGVIVDTAEHHYLAWKKLADELQVPFDRTVNEKMKGLGRMESLEVLLAQGAAAGRETSFTAAEKAELAARKNGYYISMIEHITPDDILPGIRSLLAELRGAGIKTGLASASHNAKAVLRRLELEDMFDAVADPGQVKKGKPDPELFLQAAELLGVQPAHCIGIEDAEAGVAAIRAAGMFAVGVGSAERLGGVGADNSGHSGTERVGQSDTVRSGQGSADGLGGSGSERLGPNGTDRHRISGNWRHRPTGANQVVPDTSVLTLSKLQEWFNNQ